MTKRQSTAKRSSTRAPAGRTEGSRHRGLPPGVRDLLFLLIIALLAVFVYRGYIIDGRVEITPDMISQAVPFDRFVQDYEKRHEGTPLWYPYIFGGMPFQASGTYHELQYSFEALVNAILPEGLISALHGRFFFHLLLGAVAMYYLGRALSLSRGACFVAATAFVFSTHMMATEHANRFICFMHIPLVFLAAYRVFERGRVYDGVLLGGALGSQLCSFHPQIAFYTAMLIGLYAVYAVTADLRGSTAVRTVLKKAALFTGGIGLAVAVAAVLVLPMQEYAQYSARSLSVGGSDVNVPFATSWSFPPIEILTFVIPSFSGFGGPLYWGDMPFTDFPNYLGIGVVVLAAAGIALNRSRMTLFLVIVAVLALLVSFGKHLPPVSYVLLHFVPFFGKFRAPVMILVLLQFAVALLAGYGAHALAGRIRAGKDVLGTFAKRLCLVAGGVLLLAVGLTAFETSFQSLMTGIYEQADAASRQGNAIPGNADYQTRINAMRFEQLMDDLWIMTLLLCAVSALVYATRKTKPALFIACVSALVVFDLFLVASRVVNPQDDPAQIEAYYAARETEIVKALKADTGLYRILPLSEFASNEYGYFGIATVGGYHAAKLGNYQELMDRVGLHTFPVLNMLNTRYLVTGEPLQGTGLTAVVESEGRYLYRNDAALPRAFLVDSVQVETDGNALFEALGDPEFRPGAYAFVEQPVPVQLGPRGDSSVEITLHTPHRIEMVVDAAAPCLLVLSEIYYPAGWRAEIGGEPAEIYKTNYVLRSVVVPKGRHDVTMTFEPQSFTTGYLLSRIGSALVLLGLAGAGAMRIRKRLARTSQSHYGKP